MAAVTLATGSTRPAGSPPIVGSLTGLEIAEGEPSRTQRPREPGIRDRRSPPVEEREPPIPGVRFVPKRQQVSCPRVPRRAVEQNGHPGFQRRRREPSWTTPRSRTDHWTPEAARLLSREPREGHCWIRTQWSPARGVWAVAVAARRAGVHHRQCEVVVAVRLGSACTRGRRRPLSRRREVESCPISQRSPIPRAIGTAGVRAAMSCGLRSGWRLRVCIAVRCAMVVSWRMSAGLRTTCHVVTLMTHRDPRRRHRRETDGSAPSRRSIPRGDRLVVRDGLRVSRTPLVTRA